MLQTLRSYQMDALAFSPTAFPIRASSNLVAVQVPISAAAADDSCEGSGGSTVGRPREEGVCEEEACQETPCEKC